MAYKETGLRPASACRSQHSVCRVKGGMESGWAVDVFLEERTEFCLSFHFLLKSLERWLGPCAFYPIPGSHWKPSLVLPEPRGCWFQSRTDWIQILAFPSLHTFKSLLFTPHSSFLGSCILLQLHQIMFGFQTSLCTSVQSAFLSERLSCWT